MPRSCSFSTGAQESARLGCSAAAGDQDWSQLLFCPQKEGEQWQEKPLLCVRAFPALPGHSCQGAKCQRGGIASWLLSPCPGNAARAPGCAWTHLWAQSRHSVPGLLLKSIPALCRWSAAHCALCPCGRAVQAVFVAGSHSLKTDIVLLGVQALLLFAFFVFSQGLFRVWICYCQSLKAGTPNKGWPLVGSP